MRKIRLAPLALALALAAAAAHGASLTPPNLVGASSLANPDLLLVWPYASGGPLEAMSWSVFKSQMAAGLAGSFLAPSNNLSDLGNPTIARANLGLTLGTSGANLCLLNSACTWSALQSFAASNAGGAGVNLGAGTAPSAPNDGDLWITSTGAYARVGGATHQLDAGAVSGAVKGNGSGAVSQASCADLSDGGNGGCAGKLTSGSLTPTLAFLTPGTSSFSYALQEGAFACQNGVVSGWGYVRFTPTTGTASSHLYWSNPPYAETAFNGTISPPLSTAVSIQGTWSGLVAYPYFFGAWTGSAFILYNYSGSSESFIDAANTSSGSQKELAWNFSYTVSSC